MSGPPFARFFRVNFDSWRAPVSRRDFAREMAGAIAGIVGFPSISAAFQEPPGQRLLLGVAYSSGTESFHRGVELGRNEALRTGAVLGKTITTYNISLESSLQPREVIDALSRKGVSIVIVCVSESHLREMAVEAKLRGMVMLNCCVRSNALRRGFCDTIFHIEASDAMYADAAAQSPGSKGVKLWDAGLERYGAAQLNDRFRDFARAPMDEPAWAGWVAAKIAWETFLRSPTSMAATMGAERMQFDGHKGAPLSFRAWDRQLRQPLYAIADRVIDVPDTGRSQRPVRELLDTLGERSGTQSCAR